MTFKILAKAFGMSMTQFGKELGCCRTILSGTDSGKRPAHARTLKAILNRLERVNSEMRVREQTESALRAMDRTAMIHSFKEELIERGLIDNERQTDES